MPADKETEFRDISWKTTDLFRDAVKPAHDPNTMKDDPNIYKYSEDTREDWDIGPKLSIKELRDKYKSESTYKYVDDDGKEDYKPNKDKEADF